MEHHIEFPFRARYYSLGNDSTPSQIWYVLHGYGQLARFFIRKFSILKDHNILVIAPEGLSRFYLQDTEERMRSGNNRVGSTWMTREDRLTDIANYLRFLNTVYHQTVTSDHVPVTVLGFSQGAATATRWVLDGNVKFQRLYLWAGILPADIDFTHGTEVLKTRETCLIFGNKDPFINDSRFAEMSMLSEKIGITPRLLEFDGEHNIDPDTLLKLI